MVWASLEDLEGVLVKWLQQAPEGVGPNLDMRVDFEISDHVDYVFCMFGEWWLLQYVLGQMQQTSSFKSRTNVKYRVAVES